MASDEATMRAQQLAELIRLVETGVKPYTSFVGYMPAMRWALACLEAHPEYDGISGLRSGRLERFRDVFEYSKQ